MSRQRYRLILHAGLPTTAGTSLRFALRDLRPALAKHGVAVVTQAQIRDLPGRRGFVARGKVEQKERRRFQEALRALVAASCSDAASMSGRTPEQVIVSDDRLTGTQIPGNADSPVFRPRTESTMREFIDVVEPESTHVALYTRRQDRLIEACYVWEVQKGRFHPLEEQFPYLADPVLSHTALIERMISVDGVDSIRVRPFEQIGAGVFAFADDFLSNVGLAGKIAMTPLKHGIAEIPPYSQKAFDIALALNPELTTNQQRAETRQFLRREFPVRTYGPARPLSTEQRRSLLKLYRPDNRRLFEEHMPDLDPDSYSTEDAANVLETVLDPHRRDRIANIKRAASETRVASYVGAVLSRLSS